MNICTDFCLVIFSPEWLVSRAEFASGIMLTWFWILTLWLNERCDLGQVTEPICVSSSSSVKRKLEYVSHEVLWRAWKYTFHYETLQTQVRNTEKTVYSPRCSPCSYNSVDVLDPFVLLPPSQWIILKQILIIWHFICKYCDTCLAFKT